MPQVGPEGKPHPCSRDGAALQPNLHVWKTESTQGLRKASHGRLCSWAPGPLSLLSPSPESSRPWGATLCSSKGDGGRRPSRDPVTAEAGGRGALANPTWLWSPPNSLASPGASRAPRARARSSCHAPPPAAPPASLSPMTLPTGSIENLLSPSPVAAQTQASEQSRLLFLW